MKQVTINYYFAMMILDRLNDDLKRREAQPVDAIAEFTISQLKTDINTLANAIQKARGES